MKLYKYLALIFLTGCAAVQRDCASCSAKNFGSDWLIVQYAASGEPINCWQERNVSMSNEEHSDGIYWQEPSGHLVHISGWYNHVQVTGGDFKAAAKTIGVDTERCPGGKYLAK